MPEAMPQGLVAGCMVSLAPTGGKLAGRNGEIDSRRSRAASGKTTRACTCRTGIRRSIKPISNSTTTYHHYGVWIQPDGSYITFSVDGVNPITIIAAAHRAARPGNIIPADSSTSFSISPSAATSRETRSATRTSMALSTRLCPSVELRS